MVCPHGSTAVGLTLSNRYSKHTGQFWRMLFSTHTWLPYATQSYAWHSPQGFSADRACLAHRRIMLGTAHMILAQLCILSFPGMSGKCAHAQRSLCRKQACYRPAAQEESNHICELCPPEALCQAMAHQSETGCKQRAQRD